MLESKAMKWNRITKDLKKCSRKSNLDDVLDATYLFMRQKDLNKIIEGGK